jgi:hypothetical protein
MERTHIYQASLLRGGKDGGARNDGRRTRAEVGHGPDTKPVRYLFLYAL